MNEEPLIYTSKGNLPIASLEYKHYRQDTPDAIVFIEEYLLNGESVKRSVNVFPFGASVSGDAGQFPGA